MSKQPLFNLELDLSNLRIDMNERFDQLDEKIDSNIYELEEKIVERFDQVDDKIEINESKLEEIRGRIGIIEKLMRSNRKMKKRR